MVQCFSGQCKAEVEALELWHCLWLGFHSQDLPFALEGQCIHPFQDCKRIGWTLTDMLACLNQSTMIMTLSASPHLRLQACQWWHRAVFYAASENFGPSPLFSTWFAIDANKPAPSAMSEGILFEIMKLMLLPASCCQIEWPHKIIFSQLRFWNSWNTILHWICILLCPDLFA